MWSFRTARWRRWPLAAVLLLTAAAGALLSGPWVPAADLGDLRLTWTTGEPAAAPAATPARRKRLEFYGAARNLFSSDSRSVSPSPASPSTEGPLPMPMSSDPRTSSVSAGLASHGLSSVTTENGPSAGHAASVKEASATDTPLDRVFDRFDRELERVPPEDAPPLTDAWLKERESEYISRRRRLKRACRRYKVGLAESTTERSVTPTGRTDSSGGPVEMVKVSHFTVVPPQKTMTCLVNKAASSSLLGTFLKLTGHGVPVFDELRSPHSIAKVLHPTKRGQFELAKRHYFKFMFVRHPLERLISAYEDKVVKADHPSLLYLRKSIFNTHENIHIRNQAYALLRLDTANRTAVLADYDAKLAEYWAEVKARDNVPTFSEFLEFVLAKEPTGDNFDSHWTPYWRQCSPCHIHYDVIGKLETGVEDFKYVWHQMKIYGEVKIPWTNSLHRKSTSLKDHVRKYLTPVKSSVISKLGDMFRLDFEMFGYDWEEMLRWSGHCPSGGPCSLA